MTARISLTSFIDFTARTGSPRMGIPTTLRAMYEDGSRRPWTYYEPFRDALIEEFRVDEVAEHVDRAVAEALDREATMRRLRGLGKNYAALAAGSKKLRDRVGRIEVIDAPHGSWTHEDLTVRVNPPLAIRRASGACEAWYLYPKDTGLTRAGADAALAIMTDVLDFAGARDMTPAVINVRTGERFTLRKDAKLDALRHYARSEAEAFMRLWNVSAGAA